ncbi:MAG: hypothetical protein QW815_09300 [Nitrososphaerota archaeon]
MSEVRDIRQIPIHFIKCDICKRVFVSLHERELMQNFLEHARRHGSPAFLKAFKPKVRLVSLEEEAQ